MLRPGFRAVAELLQEAAMAMTHSDLHKRVQKAISDKHPNNSVSLIDVAGDENAGHAIYSKGYYGGDLKKAAFTGAKNKGVHTISVDTEHASDVMPRTTYDDVPDGTSAARESLTKIRAALTEAGARNSKADATSIQAIHDSAQELGATCDPENAAEDAAEKTEEARRRAAAGGGLKLVESAATFLTEIKLQEATRTSYPVLLISPGTGSKAHYPAAVLERDGPKVAKKGTLLFWNHATKAEEAARPEGNLDNLAAILTSDAKYDANGAKGPGLYGTAKVMGDYAQKVEERAPHIGLSIRGGGTGDGTMIDGVPVLKSLDYIESVDYVTKAGRGGLALAEAARSAGIESPDDDEEDKEDDGMNVQEATQLRESTARLLDRAIRGDAREAATEVLADFTLAEAAKKRVIETVLGGAIPKTAAGELDRTAFSAVVTAEAKREGAYVARLVGSGRVAGMGAGVPALELTEAQRTAADAQRKRDDEDAVAIFESFPGMSKEAAAIAAKGRAA
jgi:hypothetical protein